LPSAPWLRVGTTKLCGSATVSNSQRGFGTGEAGEIPAFDLMAELKPEGWAGLGRMEPLVPGKGSVLAMPTLVKTPVAAESHEDGGCGA